MLLTWNLKPCVRPGSGICARSLGLRVRPRSWPLRLLAGFLIAVLAVACGRSQKPNVLLISIDSLRADHLGAYGYGRSTSPTIDRLAAGGALFLNAVSSTSWTLPAHITLMTGLPDSSHGVTTVKSRLNPDVVTLAQAFKAAGYYTAGFYSGPFLHPAFGFDRGFDRYVDCTSYRMGESKSEPKRFHRASHSDVTNPRVLWQVNYQLDRVDKRRFFFFVHLWDVHYDYVPPPPFDRLFDPDYAGSFSPRDFGRNKRFRPGMEKADYEHIVALYDGEIRFTDQTLTYILLALDSRGLLRDTLVVITADHGDEFLDHGDKGHRHTLYQELVHVPLIFWYPRGIRPHKIDEFVSLMDVAPTILDMAGVAALKGALGMTLRPQLEGVGARSPRPVLAELSSVPRSPDLTALLLRNEKVIINENDGSAVYFDLSLDPKEAHPRDTAETPEARRLVQLAATLKKQYRARALGAREQPPRQLGDATRGQLRALGYVK